MALCLTLCLSQIALEPELKPNHGQVKNQNGRPQPCAWKRLKLGVSRLKLYGGNYSNHQNAALSTLCLWLTSGGNKN